MNLSKSSKLIKSKQLNKDKFIFEFENDNNFYIWDRNKGIDKYNKDMNISNMEPCRYHVSIINAINNYIKSQK